MTDEERSRLAAAITALVPAPPAHVRERGGSDLLVTKGEGLTRGEAK
jgi:hypothetical protein